MKYLIILSISVIFLFSIAACNFLINIPEYNSMITFEGLPADNLLWLSSSTETVTFKVKVKDVSPVATFCATVDSLPVTIASSDITRDASNATITVHLTPSLPSMKFEFSIFDGGKEVASKEVELKFGKILSPKELYSTSLSEAFGYYALEEDQTYHVNFPLKIPSGKTLYIRSGVVMRFNENMGITVEGALKTSETISSTAKLTSYSTSSFKWDGITVKKDGFVDISNVHIEKAKVGIKVEDQSEGGELRVSRTTFRGNNKGICISSTSGMDSTATPIVITGSTFEHNDIAGIEVERGYVDVENCEFNGNAVTSQATPLPTNPSDIASATGGIVLWQVTDSTVNNNTFTSNNVGIFAYYSHFSVDYNELNSNYRAGIYLYDSNPEMEENNIKNATSTTFAASSVYTSRPICLFIAGKANTTSIEKNSFSAGSIGIYIATNTSSEATQLHLNHNDIYDNRYNFYNDAKIRIDATYNYWGITDESTSSTNTANTAIDATLYPNPTDTSAPGHIYYVPWSASPYL